MTGIVEDSVAVETGSVVGVEVVEGLGFDETDEELGFDEVDEKPAGFDEVDEELGLDEDDGEPAGFDEVDEEFGFDEDNKVVDEVRDSSLDFFVVAGEISGVEVLLSSFEYLFAALLIRPLLGFFLGAGVGGVSTSISSSLSVDVAMVQDFTIFGSLVSSGRLGGVRTATGGLVDHTTFVASG